MWKITKQVTPHNHTTEQALFQRVDFSTNLVISKRNLVLWCEKSLNKWLLTLASKKWRIRYWLKPPISPLSIWRDPSLCTLLPFRVMSPNPVTHWGGFRTRSWARQGEIERLRQSFSCSNEHSEAYLVNQSHSPRWKITIQVILHNHTTEQVLFQ